MTRPPRRIPVFAAALAAVAVLATGCSEPPVDRSVDPSLDQAISRMLTIGGPDGWEVRRQSLALVDPSIPGERLVLARQGLSAQFRLSDSVFYAVTGWDSPEVDRTDPAQVEAVCQMFTGWLVQTATTIISPAGELGDFWAEDCVQVLTDPNAEEGETVWFTEASAVQVRDTWFVGAVTDVQGDTVQLTAVLGVAKHPYGDAPGMPLPTSGSPSPSTRPSAPPTPPVG